MITIVDYGMGNLRSVYNAFLHLGANVRIVSNTNDIMQAEKLILPGVGAFGDAVNELHKRNLYNALVCFIKKGKPFLGICLGLQLLFEESEEAPGVEGLAVFQGRIKKFRKEIIGELKIPHMGWNKFTKTKENDLLTGIENDYCYFVHSYYADISDKYTLSETDYGIMFSSIIGKDNVFATQFHPEKSQEIGLKILKNFMEL